MSSQGLISSPNGKTPEEHAAIIERMATEAAENARSQVYRASKHIMSNKGIPIVLTRIVGVNCPMEAAVVIGDMINEAVDCALKEVHDAVADRIGPEDN